jgi:phage terminase large subunit GpA-like protein
MTEAQFHEILNAGSHQLSTIKPSDWNEKYRSMDSSVSRFKGRFSYDWTPYAREIVDCLSPSHPARRISLMNGAQLGGSVGVIEAGVIWIISEQPGNILFLTGHSDLSEEAIEKIDNAIDSTGIRHLIRPNIKRRKTQKTGDTNFKKEFPGGSLVMGSVGNHKLLMQRSCMYGFADDLDAAKQFSKSDGSTVSLIEQRFASYADKMKLFFVSTPRLKQSSNIEPVYLLGDQRKYHIPCPCCGEFIVLSWKINIDGSDEVAGITYKLDESNKLIKGSVGYICQKCGGFFNDSNKYELNLAGHWVPTAIPSVEGYYSYHISSLYTPPGMYDWEHYVRQYLEANPPGGKQIEHLQKTFVNLCLGETYDVPGESPRANELQKNIRNYEIGTIPEKLSLADGNGKIVLITCACDLNGVPEDARLDYEILAWSESGATYSIDQASIGTFVPREGAKKNKADRERWTYEHNRKNSVWKELEKVIGTVWQTDTGRSMKIFVSGIDTGHYNSYAYPYIDKTNYYTIALKGKDADKYIPFGKDLSTFKPARERSNLYLVEVGVVKDQLASLIKLKWDENTDEFQPPNFMNYPQPAKGKYSFKNFFEHYESEERKVESKDGEGISARWVKKTTISQNHFWDVRVYHIALRDILLSQIFKELKIKNYTWNDYCELVKPK